MNLFAAKPHALTATLLLCAPFAQAQDATPAAPTTSRIPAGAIPRLQGDIVIDGKLDDAGWAGALEQSIDYEISPGDNTPAQAKTYLTSTGKSVPSFLSISLSKGVLSLANSSDRDGGSF